MIRYEIIMYSISNLIILIQNILKKFLCSCYHKIDFTKEFNKLSCVVGDGGEWFRQCGDL